MAARAQDFAARTRAAQLERERKRAEGMRRSPTGQIIETYRPDTIGGALYEGLGNLAGGVTSLFGGSPETVYNARRRGENFARDIGELAVGPEEIERAGRRIATGEGSAMDYVIAGLTVIPSTRLGRKAAGAIAKGGKKVVQKVTPKPVANLAVRTKNRLTRVEPMREARATVPARAASSRRPGAMPAADMPAVQPIVGNTAYATSEAVPYVSGRHRTDITAAPESVRDAFSTRPDTVWTNDAGTDVLLDVAGVPQARGVPFRGIYDPPGAPRESNYGWASRALFDTPGGRLSPEDAATMSAVQAVRTVGDVQGATPWTMPLFGLPRDEMGAMLIPTGGRSQLSQMEALNRLGQPYGLTDTLDIGDALIRTNFGGGAPSGEDLYQMMVAPAKASGSHPVMDVKSILGPRAKPMQIGTTGDYVGFEPQWEQPEGSGAVTSLLARYLFNPKLPRQRREALLEDPRVAEQFGTRFLRDEAAGMAGAPIRGDIQRAREIIAEQERLQALFDAFGRGVSLMAQGGLAQMNGQA